MTLSEFKATLSENAPPANLDVLLQALWHDANGDWHKAHELAQDIANADGSWVHAYLHRKEGDLSNASYWYSRAGRQRPDISLEEEWERIAEEFLERK